MRTVASGRATPARLVAALVLCLARSTQADDCPFTPVNNVALDLESHLGLSYSLALGQFKIFNLYWDDDWDNQNPGFSIAEIDAATRALIDPANHYTPRLCQYGVPQMVFAGSTNTNRLFGVCARTPPDSGPALSLAAVASFVDCEEFTWVVSGARPVAGVPNPLCVGCFTHPPCFQNQACAEAPNATGDTIFNVFLPRRAIPEMGTRWCPAPNTGIRGMHWQIPSETFGILPNTEGRPIYFTIIPTGCASDISNLMETVSHEMVEAATDPFPLAHWYDASQIPSDYLTDAENADICEYLPFPDRSARQDGKHGAMKPNVRFPAVRLAYKRADGVGDTIRVAPYWSNFDHNCWYGDAVPASLPSIRATVTPAPNLLGWNRTDVTVKLSATDTGGGVKQVVYQLSGGPDVEVPGLTAEFVIGDEGYTNVTFRAEDNLGRSSVPDVLPLRIDKTAPAIKSGPPSPSPTEFGWNNTDVTVDFTCADGLSGVASCSGKATVTGEGADLAASARARDDADNVAEDSVAVHIDRTRPTVTGLAAPPANVNGWNRAPVTVTFSCADALSGIAICSPPSILALEGANQSASGSALDRAANAATTTVAGINIDETPPVVSYSGNLGLYRVDDVVDVQCRATDGLSGVAATTCKDVKAQAWLFGLGVHVLSATATDRADNTGTGSTTFNVVVTYVSLGNLTRQFVTKPGVAHSMTVKLDAAAAAAARGDENAKNGALSAFRNEAEAQSGKSLTDAHALVLIQLSTGL
jgi:hypothetical protein